MESQTAYKDMENYNNTEWQTKLKDIVQQT